jgi:K+-transporting ATPase ATPase C chain
MNEGPGAGRAHDGGRIVGSALLGQSFHSKNLFHSRPSAAGDAGYDATASGATNLGPTSKKLVDAVGAAVAAARAENPASSGSPVPADAVTSSGSGLDPHISPAFAFWQVPRVARETGLAASELEKMIAARTEGRFLGLWGSPRVNVLRLNLDLVARGAAP